MTDLVQDAIQKSIEAMKLQAAELANREVAAPAQAPAVAKPPIPPEVDDTTYTAPIMIGESLPRRQKLDEPMSNEQVLAASLGLTPEQVARATSLANLSKITSANPPALGASRDNTLITGAVTKEQQQYLVGKLWLQGYNFYEIGQLLKLPTKTIRENVLETRELLRESQKADLLDLAAERIQGFSMVKKASWQEYEETRGSKWLQLVLRSEELIAKVQGVLSDKVQHLVQGEVALKLYDMDDSAFRAVEANFQVVDDNGDSSDDHS